MLYKYKNNKGFTMIELLVVIVIIGLLATIAIPKFTGVKENANIAVSKSNLKILQTSLERYCLEMNSYPEQLADLIVSGFVKSNTCYIPGTTDPYQYGKDDSNFIIYDIENDLYATNDLIKSDFTSYTGGITPVSQTI